MEGETTADKEKEDEGKDVDNKAAEPEEVGAGFKCPSCCSFINLWKEVKARAALRWCEPGENTCLEVCSLTWERFSVLPASRTGCFTAPKWCKHKVQRMELSQAGCRH